MNIVLSESVRNKIFSPEVIFSLILFCLNLISYAQSPRQLTENEIDKFELEIAAQAKDLKASLEKKDNYLSDFDKKVFVEFTIDTFIIEKLFDKKMDIDYSTAGMVNNSYELLAEYDRLLNKYYKILYSKLSPADQQVLKEAQRNWILYRDSETKLFEVLTKDEYSGGGTIQSIIFISNKLGLTKDRVFQLIAHLSLFEE